MFNTNAQFYQNISQVLLTSAVILWPTCTRGFGIREKIRCGLRFFGVFIVRFCGFRTPLKPPSRLYKEKENEFVIFMLQRVNKIQPSRSNWNFLYFLPVPLSKPELLN